MHRKSSENVVMESYIQGASTRKVREIIDPLSSEETSSQTVSNSNIAKELGEKMRKDDTMRYLV